MIYNYVLLILTAILSIGAGVLLFLSHRKPTEQANYYYILAALGVWLVACIVPMPLTIGYKAAIVLGILLTLLGTISHRLLKLPVVVIEAFHLITILLYAVAFASLHPSKWPTPWLLLLLFIAGILYFAIRSKLAELKGIVAIYTIALLLMSWQAIEIVVIERSLWSWLALGGGISFAVSKLFDIIHHAYHAELPIYSAERLQRTTLPQPMWLQHMLSKATILQRLSLRLEQMMRHGERLSSRIVEAVRLPQVAEKSITLIPDGLLLWQWLLALSIWGTAMRWMG